ncbi:MAG: oligosaccharide flippase family protein, partial [Deltaproteobacteria bacterium]|nr:oligosaccharide flippase family protein [Deltaproteobacteria bacterium]
MDKSNIAAIARNLSFLFIGQGASGVILFITMAYLARVLGPHNFGVISFAEGVLMFFLGITSLGLDYIGIREIAKAKEKTIYFTDRIVSIRLLLALLSFVLLIMFVFILRKPLITKYVTIIYGISLFSAACFLDWVFQGLEKMQFVAIGSITRALIFALGIVFLISNQEQVITVSIIYSLSWLASSIVLLIFYIRNIGLPHFNKDLTAYKSLLKDSLPIGFSILAGWVIYYFGSTMLFLLKGEHEAGIFNAAFRPIILMVTGLTLYFNAIFPIISKSAAADMYTLKQVINT